MLDRCKAVNNACGGPQSVDNAQEQVRAKEYCVLRLMSIFLSFSYKATRVLLLQLCCPKVLLLCMFQEVHKINVSNHSLYHLYDRNNTLSS
jgi:hypothetical protein